MYNDQPIDYQTIADQFRKEENAPDNLVRSMDQPASPPMVNGYVDYQAMVKAWDEEQEGKYKIHLQAGKRNPSHDPIFREQDEQE